MNILFTWWIRYSWESFDVLSLNILSHTTNFVFLCVDGIWFNNSMLVLVNYFVGTGTIYFDCTFIYSHRCLIIVKYFTIVKYFILSNMSLIWSLLIVALHKVYVVYNMAIHGLYVKIFVNYFLVFVEVHGFDWVCIPPPSEAISKHLNDSQAYISEGIPNANGAGSSWEPTLGRSHFLLAENSSSSTLTLLACWGPT